MGLVDELDREELDRLSTIACAIHAEDFVIGYVNPAWQAFGRANGASRVWGPGDSLLAAISSPLRAFYEEHLTTTITTGAPWEHDYECSAADLYRRFHLRALLLGEGTGLLITHSLLVEHVHEAGETFTPTALAHLYRAESGLISQCAHCRRVHRVVPPETWDWVPQLVAQPAGQTTHGLCDACLAYYFSPAALER